MATNSVPGPSRPLASSSTANGTQVKATPLVPTNSVTTADGITVRARIDPTLTVDDVVKQLCINLEIKTPPANFALRDAVDELVTNDNLRKKIKAKVNLKLVNAPALEARETADKLKLRDEKTLKLTLFSLQKFIREDQFAQEFINHDGVAQLVDVIFTSHGNTLAVGNISPFTELQSHGIRLWVGQSYRCLYLQNRSDSIVVSITDQRLPTCNCYTQETSRG